MTTQQHFESRLFWKNAEKLRIHANWRSLVKKQVRVGKIYQALLKQVCVDFISGKIFKILTFSESLENFRFVIEFQVAVLSKLASIIAFKCHCKFDWHTVYFYGKVEKVVYQRCL